MTAFAADEPVYRDPPAPARLFVYSVALAMPFLTLAALILPGTLVSRYGMDLNGIVVATVATSAYVGLLVVAVRGTRRLAARFTPPLPLPGDIWNIGVAQPPKRSRNWPIRFRRSVTRGR